MRSVWRFLPIFIGLALFLPALFSTHPVFSVEDSSVIINEIMYDPVSSEGCDAYSGEWVELKNLDPIKSIVMTGWFVKDSSSSRRWFAAEIAAEGYLVLVANKTCFLRNHGGVDESLIVDLKARIGNGLNNTDSDKDGVADRVILLNEAEVEKDNRPYPEGAAAKGSSYSFDGAEWREGEPTPGALNEFPVGPEEPEEEEEEEEKPKPIINFNFSPEVAADTPFAVTVNLENFDPGTYSLKVLIGSGDQFCDGRTEGVGGSWLAWNAGWANFPTVTVDSSGLGSKVIEAKTDDDVNAGHYSIKIRVHGGTASFDSETKELEVTVETAVAGSSTDEESVGDDKAGPAVIFRSPPSAVADTPFAVTVILKDFDPGTYSLKVLIGAGDQFYDGRTEGVGGGWLAWNAGWADFPKTTVGGSGEASKTIRVKTDDDISAGRYSLKIRAHSSKENFDSAAKELTVTADQAGSASLLGEEKKDGEPNTSSVAALGAQLSSSGSDADNVLGAEDQSEANRKLNFYTILGVLGFAVGSGGLVVAFSSLSRHSKEQLGDCEG